MTFLCDNFAFLQCFHFHPPPPQSFLCDSTSVLWPLKRSSSATILSKTTVTTCLTVAAAVLLVMLSLVKCRRKHSTMAWAGTKHWSIMQHILYCINWAYCICGPSSGDVKHRIDRVTSHSKTGAYWCPIVHIICIWHRALMLHKLEQGYNKYIYSWV